MSAALQYYIRRDETSGRPRTFFTGDDFSAWSGHIHYYADRYVAVCKLKQLTEVHHITALRLCCSTVRS